MLWYKRRRKPKKSNKIKNTSETMTLKKNEVSVRNIRVTRQNYWDILETPCIESDVVMTYRKITYSDQLTIEKVSTNVWLQGIDNNFGCNI